MPPIADIELIRRLVTAALLGAALGFEREIRQKDAGLRTNILIAVGAALFTVMSIEMSGPFGDPGRIAAQIVTGIGFLGAGAIMRTDSGIQGLTTAATVWVNAAVGVAAGARYALLRCDPPMKTLACVVGARPNFVKMAPVIAIGRASASPFWTAPTSTPPRCSPRRASSC